MKKVFNNSEVAHVWASQQQQSGRSGNIFFEGRSIFSYGHHFEMARFITPEVVFITTASYSVTTSSHLGRVRRAVSHLIKFTVPSFTDHAGNLAYLIAEEKENLAKVKRARSAFIIDNALDHFEANYLAPARRYAKLFNLALPELPTIDAELRESLKERANLYRVSEHEAREKKDAQYQAQRNARALEEVAELEAWKAGKVSGWYNFAATALRVNGNDVETTHGARVPLDAARQFYAALRTGVDLSGQRVGMYTVQSVTADMAVIGCHRIPMTEIKRIETQVMQSV